MNSAENSVDENIDIDIDIYIYIYIYATFSLEKKENLNFVACCPEI
jgi:hypothetical protein